MGKRRIVQHSIKTQINHNNAMETHTLTLTYFHCPSRVHIVCVCVGYSQHWICCRVADEDDESQLRVDDIKFANDVTDPASLCQAMMSAANAAEQYKGVQVNTHTRAHTYTNARTFTRTHIHAHTRTYTKIR